MQVVQVLEAAGPVRRVAIAMAHRHRDAKVAEPRRRTLLPATTHGIAMAIAT
jgi:hypothetical protein